MQTYQHSGEAPVGGILLTGVAGLLTAVFCSVLYTYAQVWIPFIYLNLILTVLLGMAIGGAVAHAAFLGKVRNTMVVTAMGFVFALVAIYCEWGTSSWALDDWNVGLGAFTPHRISALMSYLYENGSWGWARDKENIKGYELAAIWIGEAGTIICLATATARGMVTSRPFCEECDEWTEIKEGVQTFAGSGKEPEWEGILNGDIAGLREMPLFKGEGDVCVRLDISSCPNCDKSHFLTINRVKLKQDDDDVKESPTAIVSNMMISPAGVEVARTAHKEESVVPTKRVGEDLPPLKFDE